MKLFTVLDLPPAGNGDKYYWELFTTKDHPYPSWVERLGVEAELVEAREIVKSHLSVWPPTKGAHNLYWWELFRSKGRAAATKSIEGGKLDRDDIEATRDLIDPVAPLWQPRLRVLASFAYYHKADFDDLIGSRFKEPWPEVFADSGAFSADSVGLEVTLEDYAAWLKRWEPYITSYANLDVLGDPEATAANQKRLEDMGLQPVPVFHTGTPWDQLEQLLQSYNYIALGRMVPYMGNVKVLMPWLTKAFKLAGSYAVFHGFGATNWTVVSSLPWYSVDSSSWGQGFRWGQVPVFDPRGGKFHKLKLGKPQDWAKLHRVVRNYGFDPEDFADRERNTLAKIVALSALSYFKAEEWLQRRHGPVTLDPAIGDNGPKVYLSDIGNHHLNKLTQFHKEAEDE